jgi:DNA-binding NtrC family response regulator
MNMNKKNLPNEEIAKEYLAGMSMAVLARKHYVTSNTIRKRLLLQGVRLRTRKEEKRLNPPMKGRQRPDLKIDIDEEFMKDMYLNQSLSVIEIGKRMGISRTTIRNRLIKLGIEIRPKSTYKAKKTH